MKTAAKRLLLGNHAVAWGALEAGVQVATGYPGTPSSETLAALLELTRPQGPADPAAAPPRPYVAWSVNEKVAFEIACAAAWAGQRALTTMKMSGTNVAADSILSAAYSGTRGGLVIYVADDPGAEAGMPEQDSRLFAQFAGLPLLEASSPRRALALTRLAFELSEEIGLPVILRLVTSVAHAEESVPGEPAWKPLNREPGFERDIHRYTKAGSAICLDQHHDLLFRLRRAEEAMHRAGLNRLDGAADGGPLAVACGSLVPCLRELLPAAGLPPFASLYVEGIYPLDETLFRQALDRHRTIVIFEELEPVVEMMVRSLASRTGWNGTLIGKLDGVLPRVGRYGREELLRGLQAAAAAATGAGICETASPPGPERADSAPRVPAPAVRHTITFCAGCPHRGTYLALNRALKKSGLDRKRTVVTGDIGCTILGMNPPFDSCWTEVSMGSSIGYAQGFLRAGLREPVVATIGDSTFFHAGIPPLIDAVQHRADLLVIILDNGWTSMTGFQPNPGTEEELQADGARRVDLARLVESLGVDDLQVIDPFDQEAAVSAIARSLGGRGVRVIIARAECALTAGRRPTSRAFGRPAFTIDPDRCTFCRSCLRETGCPALVPGPGGKKGLMTIDEEQCTGCGLCATSCAFDAIHPKGERHDV